MQILLYVDSVVCRYKSSPYVVIRFVRINIRSKLTSSVRGGKNLRIFHTSYFENKISTTHNVGRLSKIKFLFKIVHLDTKN